MLKLNQYLLQVTEVGSGDGACVGLSTSVSHSGQRSSIFCFYLASKQFQQILTSCRKSPDAGQSIRSFVCVAVRIRLSSINHRRLLRPHGTPASRPLRRRAWPEAAGRPPGRTVRNSDRRCWSRLLRQQFRRHHVTMEIRLRRRHARRRVS